MSKAPKIIQVNGKPIRSLQFADKDHVFDAARDRDRRQGANVYTFRPGGEAEHPAGISGDEDEHAPLRRPKAFEDANASAGTQPGLRNRFPRGIRERRVPAYAPDADERYDHVKRQADRLKSNPGTKQRADKRGTAALTSMLQSQKANKRSLCYIICLRGPFKDKLYSFFIAQFDASVLLLPLLFKRCGWATCTIVLVFLQLLGMFSSVLVYECIRLLLGNYRMKQQGVDFESLLSNFKHIATHGSFTNQSSKPWLSQTMSSSAMVGLMKNLYILGLVLSSMVGLIMCTYTMDNLVKFVRGNDFAIQVMPEATLLEDKSTPDHLPFSSSLFSLSIGFGITLVAGILQVLILSPNQSRGGRLQGFRCLVIIAFMALATLSFLKPYLHMTAAATDLTVEKNKMVERFWQLSPFTISFGFSLGVLAFSTVLSQLTVVPELMMNDPKYERDSSPYHEYFKLPLVLANIGALAFKWCFAAAGAIAFTQDTNLFAGLLFSKSPNDAVLGVLAVFALLIVLPNSIHLQRQAKYFATLSSEDSIPCNQYLVGILLPWVLAAVLCHLQIFMQLVNFTSLVCCLNVAVVCSFLMWTTQLEESMVHQTNF